MIARIWRGWTSTGDADAYGEYLKRTGIKEYRKTPGIHSAYFLRREDGDRTKFVTLNFWDSPDAVKGFAGEDVTRAVFDPEDDRQLGDRDATVTHHEVP